MHRYTTFTICSIFLRVRMQEESAFHSSGNKLRTQRPTTKLYRRKHAEKYVWRRLRATQPWHLPLLSAATRLRKQLPEAAPFTISACDDNRAAYGGCTELAPNSSKRVPLPAAIGEHAHQRLKCEQAASRRLVHRLAFRVAH